MPRPKTWQLTAGAAAVGLALSAGSVALAGPWDSGQRTAERERAASWGTRGGAHHQSPMDPEAPAPAPSAPGVLAALGTPGGAPVPAALPAALAPLLADPALGPHPAASVLDTATGQEVYAVGADAPMTPASTVKIATAAAALTALPPDHRFTTTVVAPADGGALTLVGGGDPTLDKARLAALADDTARALRARSVASVQLAYDASLFSGSAVHPIGPNENLAPVVALMTDEGRLDGSDSGPASRTTDPAGDTARAFARLLRARGLTVADPAPGGGPADAKALASTVSAPLPAIVERMLTNSDNDIAEALARHTALALHKAGSFDGVAEAVPAQLAKLQLPWNGSVFADGSGLDRTDRVTAGLLTRLLAKAGDPGRPELRPILTGLPVAGFTGTLGTRYGAASAATGLVRAKTGTLAGAGVNTLAGTVVGADGRLLAFAFLSTGTPGADPAPAQRALDRLATRLLEH
ncbi:D-alanyl-D-alanine carboxypeptidase [Streptomyces hundungensis]|uniref:D-alanyl-D-alanine carboxypeptidase n=1 Tax=Streptomyces hundungensis TaxID=1077946 RepID=A0A387HGF1_9ACTN|nr:D-alanyl-D-alanine carboxypeptidase/D-alanyl-D-alanine-endopeptidase [Streptomyces hundungensis]AYG81353.1 D-alanyl-D-alanine carboxypeptidase [Streptomyces hundungensis]